MQKKGQEKKETKNIEPFFASKEGSVCFKRFFLIFFLIFEENISRMRIFICVRRGGCMTTRKNEEKMKKKALFLFRVDISEQRRRYHDSKSISFVFRYVSLLSRSERRFFDKVTKSLRCARRRKTIYLVLCWVQCSCHRDSLTICPRKPGLMLTLGEGGKK